MNFLLIYIIEIIASLYQPAVLKCTTIHNMLVTLKGKIAPTDRARGIELIDKWKQALKAGDKSDQEHWLANLERVYGQCVDIDLPEVKGHRPLFDFLQAVSTVNPSFVGYWEGRLSELQMESELQLPTFSKLLNYFRNQERLTHAESAKASHGAFAASLQGQSLEDNQSNSALKPRRCLCGELEEFKDCPYINEKSRPEGWTGNAATQRSVDEKIQSNPRLTEVVKRIRDDAKGKDSPTTPILASCLAAVFHTGGSQPEIYALKKSFILDSGSTSHLCNDRERFHEFHPASKDVLYAGNTHLDIQGYGKVMIRVKTNKGSGLIELNNVAFVPDFHTSTVSYDVLISKGMFWNGEKQDISYHGKHLCKVEKHHGQWTLEYNPLPSLNAVDDSDMSRPSTPIGTEETSIQQQPSVAISKSTHRSSIPNKTYTPESISPDSTTEESNSPPQPPQMEVLQVLDISSDDSQRCKEEEDEYEIFDDIFVTNDTSPNQDDIRQRREEDEQGPETPAESPEGSSQLAESIESTEEPAIPTPESISSSSVSVHVGDTVTRPHLTKRMKTTPKEPPERRIMHGIDQESMLHVLRARKQQNNDVSGISSSTHPGGLVKNVKKKDKG